MQRLTTAALDGSGVLRVRQLPGAGGLRASCGEENLLAPDADPRYAGRDVLVHEFAHCLMDYGEG